MGKDIIDIVKEKEFSQLTVDEQLELKEFCSSEDEFNQMKSVLTNIEGIGYSKESPRKETKESLDHLFEQRYPRVAPVWYSSVLSVIVPKDKPVYRQPLVQMAAVALILIMIIPFYQTELNQKQVHMAQNDVGTSETDVDEMKPIESSVDEIVTEQNNTQQRMENDATGSESILSGQISASMEPTFGSSETFSVTSNHPDGVFISVADRETVAFSLPASESDDLLDLLTSTF